MIRMQLKMLGCKFKSFEGESHFHVIYGLKSQVGWVQICDIVFLSGFWFLLNLIIDGSGKGLTIFIEKAFCTVINFFDVSEYNVYHHMRAQNQN